MGWAGTVANDVDEGGTVEGGEITDSGPEEEVVVGASVLGAEVEEVGSADEEKDPAATVLVDPEEAGAVTGGDETAELSPPGLHPPNTNPVTAARTTDLGPGLMRRARSTRCRRTIAAVPPGADRGTNLPGWRRSGRRNPAW